MSVLNFRYTSVLLSHGRQQPGGNGMRRLSLSDVIGQPKGPWPWGTCTQSMRRMHAYAQRAHPSSQRFPSIVAWIFWCASRWAPTACQHSGQPHRLPPCPTLAEAIPSTLPWGPTPHVWYLSCPALQGVQDKYGTITKLAVCYTCLHTLHACSRRWFCSCNSDHVHAFACLACRVTGHL